jgi:sulfate permease, SulP family
MENDPFWTPFIPKSWLLLKKGYPVQDFKKDLFAGVTVGLVALPLAMAFAIASGVSPEQGIYTAIVASFLISLLGGSRFQIGGPTGAFVVLIYAIIQRQGYEGLAVVTLFAGALLLIAAFSKLGNLIRYVPYPLITGFTTGIAVIIFSSQIKDFFGLKITTVPADFIPKWKALLSALPTFDGMTFLIASGTLILIILLRRYAPILPWGILSVATATLITGLFQLPTSTIESRFGALSSTLSLPTLPKFSLSLAHWPTLLSDTFAIAFLAGIESLLSAVVADKMAGTSHKPNCELLAQGIANIGSALCGGIPATGAIARTATNIKTGAKTPIAGMIHAITLLLILLLFAPIVGKIPLAALAAVLIMVAWNMSELDHCQRLFKAPLGDVALLLSTFLLTVLVDLTVAVTVGMILASISRFLRKKPRT